MFVFARRSPVVLFGAFVLAPFLNALPAQGVEDECVHLTGQAGPTQSAPVIRARSSALSSGTQGGTLAAGICAVDNARFNSPTPTKTNADFVPVTGDDARGFYCVYGVKASSTGGVGGNVGIFLFELAGGEVLVFGSGYGNIPGANLFDAAYDMERVDQVIRFCMGKDPATTPLRLLAPHGHADHVNPAANRELERLGYTILEIAFHPADFALINGMGWTTEDRALFRLLPAGTNCLEELASYASPLGKLWVYHRPGHTDGSIDLVVDVGNDAGNRFLVRGSQTSSPCAPLTGQRESADAHGNVVLVSVPPSLSDVTPLAGTAQGGTALSLTGAMFTASGAGTPKVLVDGVAATDVVVTSDTTLTCKTPAGPPGELVDVALVNNNGKSVYAGTFFYNPLPTLTSISPVTGDWRGGTIVQVRGSGFLLSAGVNEVFFGTTRASQVAVKSDDLLTCRAPAGTPGAVVTVRVRNPNGEAKLDNAFRYSASLAITAVDPPSASALGGTIVLLTGIGFTGTGTTPAVTFGGTPSGVVTLLSDTTVLAVVPPGPQGTPVDIVLTNSAGSATFTGFRYHAFPRLTSLSPTGGRDSGGTTVTLSGSGFLVDGAGTNQVRFGGTPATQVTVLSDGSLRCAAPAGTRDTSVNVTVSNQNGTAALPLAFTYTGPLEVSSLLPTAGTSLGGTTVTLAGVGFVDGPAGTTTVRFGGVLATNVVAVDNLTLTCRAPAGTPQALVDLEVTNQNGTVTLPGAYRYHARPTLTAVTPNHGLGSASTLVTLTGTGFLANQAGTNTITVGGAAATNVTVASDTSLTCRFPAGTPGTTVNVVLANLNGSATLAGGFRYHAAPTLTGATPNHGRAGGPTAVTLSGTGFLNDQAGVNAITVGGNAATNVTVVSDTSLTCSFPGGTAGTTVNVGLTNLNGSASLTGGFRYHAAPTLTAVTPNHGNAGAFTPVTVTGTGFLNDQAGVNAITVGGNAATSVQVVSDTSILCNFPPGTPSATVDVVLTNQNGSATLGGGYRYHGPPTLTGISPASGGSAQQQRVTLAGSGFLNDQAGIPAITFGGLAATAVSVTNDTSLRCNVPVGPAGETVDVVLSNARGTATLPQAYRFHARPELTAVTPSVGSSQGGTQVTLTGSGFLVDGAGVNVVNFGGAFASSVVVVSDTTVRCTTPAGLQDASVDVVISNTNGTASLANAFSYSIAPPVVSAVSPPSGPAQLPGSVTLTGSGFLASGAGPNTVRFGSQTAGIVAVLDDTRLTCQVPAGTPGTQVDVTVVNANGQGQLARGFRYHALPTLTSISPVSASVTGGTLVTLTGTGFVTDAPGTNTVTFGGLAAPGVTVVSNTTLTCFAPAGTSGGTVEVRVSNANGQTAARSFSYHPRPTLLVVTPGSGPMAGGTRVVLQGTGFQVNGAGPNSVRFGKTLAANVTVVSDAEITCISPRGDGGYVDVTVSNKNGTATQVRGFHYGKLMPAITSIEPPSGTARGQTLVTIRGHGFAGAGANAVRIGAALATGILVLDDETLQCTAPAGPAGTRVDVALTNDNGAATLAQGYRYHARPALTSISPTQGEALKETRVSLSGSGFAVDSPGENVVLFGGIRARDVRVKSDALLTCEAMGGGPGSVLDVTVRNANGSASLDDAYRVIGGPPTIENLSPGAGPYLGGTLVTLTGKGYDAGSVRVAFGDVPALDVRVLGPTQVTCLTPPGTLGATVAVKLSTRDGAAVVVGGFTYEMIRPVLGGLAPDHGPSAGGTRVTLSGTGFTAPGAGAARVSFGGVPATNVVVLGDAGVACTTPAGTAGTSVDVALENSNGRSTLPGAFRYHVQPTLAAVTPAVGRPQGGTLVTLTGTGFTADAAGTNQVLFEGVPALGVSVISDTLLVCTTPPGAVNTSADVRISNANGAATLNDAFRYRDPPQISGVIPGTGPTSGGTSLTLTGTGFQANAAGVNRITIGGVPALDVVTLGDTALTCTTAGGTAGPKDVMVTNDNGSSTAAGAFTYVAGPTLASIAPDHGPDRGGTRVTVTGAGFFAAGAGQNRVFFGGVPATGLSASSDTTIVCTAPAGTAGARVDVRIVNALGSATLAAAFRYHDAPVVTQVSPDHGSRNGAAVTLIGRGFQLDAPGANAIAFGGVPATQVVVLSDTQLTCQAPAGLPGTRVDVTLSNTNGASTLPVAFRYHAEPTLTAVVSPRGPSGGGPRLTLTGTGFLVDDPGVTLVVIGGTGASDVQVASDTSLTCVLPPGPVDTRVDVTVANSNGQATLVDGFRYNPLPTLTSIQPAQGPATGGSTVTLTGSGFVLGNPGPNQVLFGGVAATIVTVPDDSTLVCLAPAGTPGASVDVSLTNLSGTATLSAAFRYHARPVLSALAPDHGPASGGTAVILSGSGFSSGAPNAVTFAGAPATDVVVVDDTTLTCVTPAGTASSNADVRLTNAGGDATLPAAFRYHAVPVLTGISPTSGPAAGGTTVTLSGSGFLLGAPNTVTFGGVPATSIVVIDDATLTCVTPAGTAGATVDVELANLDSSARLAAGFLYRGGPVLSEVTPAHGPSAGGTAVTLSGAGFAQGGPNTVRFGATAATSVVVVDDATLTCLTPAGSPGTTVDVRVANSDGTATLVAGYRYHPRPGLSSLAPNHGPASGGTAVTLTGSGFTGGPNTVRFGGIQATAVVVVSDSTLTCVTPAGTAGTSVDVRVTNVDGTSVLQRAFRYHARPVLASVAPTHGSSRRDTSVTLSGTGFLNDDAGTNAVLFGAAAPLSVTVVDDATLSCLVAPQAAGTVVDVRVTNANGQAALAAAFTFDLAPPPTLSGIAPATGLSLGGTTVTLGGAGFQDPSAGATTVTFGAASATGVVVLDDATVQCQTPPGTPGAVVDVTLSNQNGSAQLAGAFTYLAPAPTLAGLLPVSGPGAGGGTITLTGSGFVANGAGTNTVTFSGLAASNVVVLDDTTLTCLVPAGTQGTQVDVELRNANGAAELPAGYRYHRLPEVTSVSPAGGSSLGGTPVTVRGSGYVNDSAGTVTVKFADRPATLVSVLEDGRLTCRVPPGTAGASVAVTVTCANGEAVLLDGFKYSPTPTVTAVTPADGTALGGTRVTVSGTGFLANGASQNAVTFGVTRATSVVVRTDRLIDCTVPPGVSGQSVTVTVNNVNGAGSLANGWRYHRRPTLASLSPVEGPLAGGTLVTLTGTGFQVDSPGTNRVTFGGVQATDVTVLDDTSLTCLTPAAAASGPVDVVIANDNGANALPDGFTYGAVPIVAAALPGKGTTQGSTTVTITGSSFQPDSTVYFGTEAATNVVVIDEQTLECQTPPSAESAWVDVTVRNWCGSACLPLGFRYAAPPTLMAIDPPTGTPDGGSMVVLTGTGFVENGAGTNRVTFGTEASPAVTVLDDQHLACEVPAGQALSEVDVAVANDNGTAVLERAFLWKMLLATDLNSDGRGDVILGSPGDDTLGTDAGAVRVFFGSPLPFADRSSGEADLTALPERVATAFGMPVASGDLDGDDHAELVIGAPLDDRLLRDAGAVYVFDGPLAGSPQALALSQAATVLTGARQHDRFGTALALADLDRNGVLDLLVGMPGDGGAVHVFLGGAGGLARQASARIAGGGSNESFASSLAAGDLDGDGWPEIVAGAPNALGLGTGGTIRPGAARVYRGGPGLLAGGTISPWLVFSGVEAGEGFGSDLSIADLNADGVEDLVVGSPWSSSAGLQSGAAFTFLGGSGITGGVASIAQAVLEAEGPGDRFGIALATGDVDGDDLADLLVGAPLCGGEGRAYLFRGSAAFADRTAAQADVQLRAEAGSQGEFGASVALIDVDGNGLADMVVTAPALDAGGTDIGRVYVFGSSALPWREGENDDATLTGKAAGELLGRSTTGDH